MDWRQAFKHSLKSVQDLLKQHAEYRKKSAHRCAISAVKYNPNAQKTEIWVKIRGVKYQPEIKFTPEELIACDELLAHFSQTDVRAIAYCAFKSKSLPDTQETDSNKPQFFIKIQNLNQGKSIFVVQDILTGHERWMSAGELLYSKILPKFSFHDMRKIIYTAAQEDFTKY